MGKEALKVLDFDRIISKLSELCTTEGGREFAKNLIPFEEFDIAQAKLKETTEVRRFYELEGTLPFLEFMGIERILERIKVSSILSGDELLKVSLVLNTISEINSMLSSQKNEFPILATYGRKLSFFKKLVTEIKDSVEPDGTISDKASPLLGIIRREIHATYMKIQTILQHIIYSKTYEGIIQDQIITRRNGRYVIPIKQSGKNAISCVIQDESSSRLTLFVEPLSVVDLNNKLVELASKEKQEVERIILQIESDINVKMEEIIASLNVICELDFIFARAKLSIMMDASEPQLTKARKIRIVQGRHPFIPRGQVVPIDISVGNDYYMLIITGPNTGGKTVTLKTIGLFTIMAKSGLHIPAYSDSEIGFFKEVFADIGDEQSIQQSLSTFSAHMRKIIQITKEANPDSLVLIDELGAGTDPEEGSALGFAVLKYLYDKRILTVVSTHHSKLKEFPYEFSFAKNASVGFDVDTLKPTYKLYVGVPGESHAFIIAEKLGISDKVLNIAKKELSEEHIIAQEYLSKISQDQKKIGASREEIEMNKKKIKELKALYEEKLNSIELRKKLEIKKAYSESQRIVAETREKMDNLMKKLDNEIRSQKQIQMIKVQVSEESKKAGQKILNITERKQDTAHLKIDDISDGDLVYVRSFKQQGIVIHKDIGKEKVIVQMGGIRATLPIIDLFKIPFDKIKNKERKNEVSRIKIPEVQVPMKLDLHGYTVAEAIEALDKYLDSAYLMGLPFVYIVHGKGTGVLRKAVLEYLRRRAHVAHFQTGTMQEGGTGVTIVYLK